jgi:ribosomal protein S18 acetylase RimI-like enzyme
MEIRRANATDLTGINKLLKQVLDVHHNGRPDLFKANAKKYTDEELLEILADDSRPIFVAVDGGADNADSTDNADDAGSANEILGYAFCLFQQHIGNNILTDVKTLYIDDLCVDEEKRGMHIGAHLYRYVLDFAKASGCYNVTLNVWACNEGAARFYEKMGLKPQKIGMEQIL